MLPGFEFYEVTFTEQRTFHINLRGEKPPGRVTDNDLSGKQQQGRAIDIYLASSTQAE